MLEYIIVFSLTTLLFKLGEKVKRNERIICDYFAITILCIFAGLRAPGIGTDTLVYLDKMYDAAIKSSDFFQYLRYEWWNISYSRTIADEEIGFTLFVYIIANIFDSLFAVQFFIQILIIIPIYYGIRNIERTPVWLGMLTFDLIIYNSTFNMIRQSIAMSFVFLSVILWMKEKRNKSIISMIMAVLFHKSAAIGIGIIGFYRFLHWYGFKNTISADKIRSNKKNIIENFRFIFLILGGILILLLTPKIVLLLSVTPIFSEYVGYIDGNVRFMPNQILYRLVPLLIMLVNYKELDKNTNGEARFYVLMVVYTMIVAQYAGIMPHSVRISAYFNFFCIISYAVSCNNGRRRIYLKPIMFVYLMFYWWFYYCYLGIDSTVPYIMMNI